MLEHIFDARPLIRFGLPAPPQNTPNIVCEPSLLRPLGPLRSLAPKDLPESGVLVVLGKWCLPSQNFVYHHPERVTIGGCRPAAVFCTEHFWLEEFWAHPSGGTALVVQACGGRFHVHRGQTEVVKAGVPDLVDQDVILIDKNAVKEGDKVLPLEDAPPSDPHGSSPNRAGRLGPSPCLLASREVTKVSAKDEDGTVRKTYKFEPICIPMGFHELIEIPICHPLRYHRKLELKPVLRNSQQWHHIRMVEGLPRDDFLVKPLHRSR